MHWDPLCGAGIALGNRGCGAACSGITALALPGDSQDLASLSHSLACLILPVYRHEQGTGMLKARSPTEQGLGLAARAVAENSALILCFVNFPCVRWFVGSCL